MIDLRMNIWWENIVQLGIPLFIVIVAILVAIFSVRKEKRKTKDLTLLFYNLVLWSHFLVATELKLLYL